MSSATVLHRTECCPKLASPQQAAALASCSKSMLHVPCTICDYLQNILIRDNKLDRGPMLLRRT
jgi:hypothetical protein